MSSLEVNVVLECRLRVLQVSKPHENQKLKSLVVLKYMYT